MVKDGICKCALNFYGILEAIDGIDDITDMYHREKRREANDLDDIKKRLLLEVKRVEKAIERTNESCNMKLGDNGLIAPIKYRIEHDETSDRIHSLTKRLKNNIISDLTFHC